MKSWRSSGYRLRRCLVLSVSMWAPTDRSKSRSVSWPNSSPSTGAGAGATSASNWRRSMRSERAGGVAGVVLAAGASTRLGRNKLFIELEGESLLRRAVRRVSDAGLDPVVVVLGHEAERARQ